jgi:Ca2+-binding RTX toxin-like protein
LTLFVAGTAAILSKVERGGDTLIGDESSSGTDYASYAGSGAGVSVNLGTRVGTGGDAANDTYVSIEGVIGSAHADTLTGGGLTSQLHGGGGNDRFLGSGGAEGFYGGADADTVTYVGSGSVEIYLARMIANTGDAKGDSFADVENIEGSNFADIIEGDGTTNSFLGGAGEDHLRGFGGDDILRGGGDVDFLAGGEGADTLFGGTEYDIADYTQAASRVIVDLANMGRNLGDAFGDVYDSIEGIVGTESDDELYGDSSYNEFFGNGGGDFLDGRGARTIS